jgi:exodeoxyribonuclease V beta subunit
MSGAARSESFDVAEAELDGFGVVEASAGTGKTFTITRLYLRLVVERGLGVDRILVVTYTVAATEELRARIRAVLAEARAQLASERVEEELLRVLVGRVGAKAAFDRVESAVSGFDEAAIFTIHGFCQRVLAEQAFESGRPFESELLPDESDLLAEIAEDFWRRRFHAASPLLAGHLVDTDLSPARLLDAVRDLVGKPYLAVIEPPVAPEPGPVEDALTAAFASARRIWRAERKSIVTALAEPGRLKRNVYAPAKLAQWATALDDLFAAPLQGTGFPDFLEKLTPARLEAGTRVHLTPPEHSFFVAARELVDRSLELRGVYGALLKRLRVDLLADCRRELAVRKRSRRLQSYDDLLIDLDEALARDPGERLAASIRERYRAALIDEFQDTDPVQYSIFKRVYRGSGLPVLLVGDPKQAIYSFRGADVFAYIEARHDARRRPPLDHNWRSAPGLVRAVNALFEGATRPFLLEEIPFQPAVPAPNFLPALVVEGDPPEPLRIRVLRRSASDPGGRRGAHHWGRATASRATAAEIARLLRLGDAGRARIGDRPLAGGDIAVLVRTNDEARLVAEDLARVGVRSVQQSMQSVFATREARELERVLLAVAIPGNETRLKAALVTEMLGVSGEELYRIQQPGGEAEWEERAERIRSHHQTWRSHGFVRAFRQLISGEGVARRLLPFHDGDRRMTNLLHLGELLAEAEVRQRLGIESLLRWLADRRSTACETRDERTEERQLRLESDENLVKVVTVHKSKGLQYEIVFCPFLWNGSVHVLSPGDRDKPFRFHDPETSQPMADLGSDQAETLRAHAGREEIAEKLRLLYVAVTRARHRCELFWGALRDSGTAAPAWLLHQSRANEALPTPQSLQRAFDTITDDELIADLSALVERSHGNVRIDLVGDAAGETARRPPGVAAVGLAARVPVRPVPAGFRIASFSALSSGGAVETTAGVHESPDHDAHGTAPSAAEPPLERTIFSFPRGLRAGRCLHAIFEHLDFAVLASPEAAARDAAIRPAVEKALAGFRIDPVWSDVVAAAVDRTVSSPLDGAGRLRLAGLTRDRAVREIEFYYPVNLDVGRWKRTLRDHGFAGGRFDREIETLSFARVVGFMKGFVDLLFESAGRFYVLDYKSNHLGDQIDDYAAERLESSIARSGYFLQYLIYTVTLHRLLRLRLPAYDPSIHLGGAFYVFLRGLDPARAPGWGVFHDRPSPALIEALDRLIDGEGPDAERSARRTGRSAAARERR